MNQAQKDFLLSMTRWVVFSASDGHPGLKIVELVERCPNCQGLGATYTCEKEGRPVEHPVTDPCPRPKEHPCANDLCTEGLVVKEGQVILWCKTHDSAEGFALCEYEEYQSTKDFGAEPFCSFEYRYLSEGI